MPTSSRTGYLLVLVTILLWSGFVIVSRLGGISPLNPYDITALRFGVAALVLIPLWLWWKPFPLLSQKLLLLGMVGGIGYSLIAYTAFVYAPASHGAVLISGLLPFFVPLMTFLILKEKPSPQLKWVLALITCGVGCLIVDMLNKGSVSVVGDSLLVLASIIWATYTVLVRRAQLDAWTITIGSGIISALIFIPIYLLFLPKGIGAAALSEVIFQGLYQGLFVVIIAMATYLAAINHLGTARVGSCMALIPAIAGLSSCWLLKEPLSIWLLLGLLMTSLAAWFGSRQPTTNS